MNRFLTIGIMVVAFFCHLIGHAGASSSPDSHIREVLQSLFTDPPEVSGFPYQEQLASAAAQYGLPLPLVLAVARGESLFDPKAKSVKGALGLMQVMPSTAADYGLKPKDLLDQGRNIDVGVHYLAALHSQLQDPYLALAAYYCGPGGVEKGKSRLRGECDEYVRYIYTHLQKILASTNRSSPVQAVEQRDVVLARFDNFLDAEKFMELLSKKLPQVQMDLLRTEQKHSDYVRYRYEILLSPDQKKKVEDPCRLIEKATGFAFCP